jgi:DNA-binding protein HU-beta
VNKSELVSEIAKNADMKREVACRALDAAINTITEALKKGDNVTLVGFGSFQVRERAARDGRNPKTGEKMKINSSKSPVFKAGKLLKDAVN